MAPQDAEATATSGQIANTRSGNEEQTVNRDFWGNLFDEGVGADLPQVLVEGSRRSGGPVGRPERLEHARPLVRRFLGIDAVGHRLLSLSPQMRTPISLKKSALLLI